MAERPPGTAQEGSGVGGSPLREALAVWGGAAAILAGAAILRRAGELPDWIWAFAPAVFLYLPFLGSARRSPPEALGLTLAGAGGGLAEAFVLALLLFPPFALLHHAWQHWVFGASWSLRPLPGAASFAFSQVLAVALPEEFFYRGYLQGLLDRAWPPRRRVFGARVGGGIPATSLLFALGHVLVRGEVYRLNVFVPSLLFGWLRARRGSLVGPVAFHAASNVFIRWLETCYG